MKNPSDYWIKRFRREIKRELRDPKPDANKMVTLIEAYERLSGDYDLFGQELRSLKAGGAPKPQRVSSPSPVDSGIVELPEEVPDHVRWHPDPERNAEMWAQVRERQAYFQRHKEVLCRLAAESVFACMLRRRISEANSAKDSAGGTHRTPSKASALGDGDEDRACTSGETHAAC